MKNFVQKFMIALVSISLFQVSCELDAPTKSTMDEQVIFSTPSFAKNTVTGVIYFFGMTRAQRATHNEWYGVHNDVGVRSTSSSAVPSLRQSFSQLKMNLFRH